MNIWPIFVNDDHVYMFLPDWTWHASIVILATLKAATTTWNMCCFRPMVKYHMSDGRVLEIFINSNFLESILRNSLWMFSMNNNSQEFKVVIPNIIIADRGVGNKGESRGRPTILQVLFNLPLKYWR